MGLLQAGDAVQAPAPISSWGWMNEGMRNFAGRQDGLQFAPDLCKLQYTRRFVTRRRRDKGPFFSR